MTAYTYGRPLVDILVICMHIGIHNKRVLYEGPPSMIEIKGNIERLFSPSKIIFQVYMCLPSLLF